MQRIDDATAATSLPTPEAAGTPGYFTEGNPTAGTPATNVRGSWLNMIQEELMAVVTAGGVTPSKTTYNQVYQALQALFQQKSAFAASLGGVGYLKIPSPVGTFILQWGTSATLAANTVIGVTFPVAFPSACVAAFANPVDPGTTASYRVNVTTVSKTGAVIGCTYSSPAFPAFWFAIGY
ncbi:hypothetical protein AWB76_06323 [Caballeronia temeraria]|uniref:Putative tail fiber protein gp53-like C-terminal domain-containing protein n=1 Tax=Caballeronia temeraria TaxID=1777137 RepID=A0A158D2C8_9BURK|nr:hypothetical protein [Caballeronia temeraria]SAK88386.1 hypothetical protein AWB76_06323 [Caballeronia temeraria]